MPERRALVLAFGLGAAALQPACASGHRSPTVAGDGGLELVANPLGACPAIETCDRACQAGDVDQCLRAGASYATGQGNPLDERQAAQRLSRACQLGSGPGCTFAGRMYEFAHGVDRDLEKALALYAQSCALAYPAGCYNLAVTLENGRGAARDEARAAALYRRVCDSGSAVACEAAIRVQQALVRTDGGRLAVRR